MIDEEWLDSLDFIGVAGYRIHGLAGSGTEKVVFKATAPDGKQLVLKTYRHHLGYRIREIPMHLSEKPRYELARLNRKLFGLMGDPNLDEYTAEYDRLYSSALKILYESWKIARQESGATSALPALISLLGARLCPYSPDALSFLVGTDGIHRRLTDLANLEHGQDARLVFPTVNGPNFPISDTRNHLIEFANQLLNVSEAARAGPLEPQSLTNNPVYVWGAAAMDGFFTDEELPEAAAFIQNEYGRIPQHPRVAVLLDQIEAVAHLLACILARSELARLMKLCGLLGLWFEVHDAKGNVVASSMGGRG